MGKKKRRRSRRLVRKITLTVYERVLGRMAENVSEARDRDTQRISTKVLERLDFSDEEKEVLKLIETDGQIKWDDKNDNTEKEIEFEDAEYRRFLKSVRAPLPQGINWPKNKKTSVFLDKMFDLKESGS